MFQKLIMHFFFCVKNFNAFFRFLMVSLHSFVNHGLCLQCLLVVDFGTVCSAILIINLVKVDTGSVSLSILLFIWVSQSFVYVDQSALFICHFGALSSDIILFVLTNIG